MPCPTAMAVTKKCRISHFFGYIIFMYLFYSYKNKAAMSNPLFCKYANLVGTYIIAYNTVLAVASTFNVSSFD